MGDTSETNMKVLSRELLQGVVALKTPIEKNHYMLDMGPFPRYCHMCDAPNIPGTVVQHYKQFIGTMLEPSPV